MLEPDAIPVTQSFTAAERELLMAVRELVVADREMRRTLSHRMDMGETDLRAVRFVMAAARAWTSTTPHELPEHLGISRAASTLLLDCDKTAIYVERRPHPT